MDGRAILIVIAVIAVVAVIIWLLVTRRRRSDVLRAGGARLRKTADALGLALRTAWGGGLADSTWEAMEDALIAADVGVGESADIVAAVRRAGPSDPAEAKEVLISTMRARLEVWERSLTFTASPAVVLVVGVNGTGKTTTVAKLGRLLSARGSQVLLAAADTFRAAAGEQLAVWGERVGLQVIGGQEGGDPASVVFDAMAAARARDADVVLIDTAGRLQAKRNLMAELSKIHKVAAGDRGSVDEALLVLDATAGQNGLSQVAEFARAVPLTGIVLTKLDGTAKGGIVMAIEQRLGVPVKFVGMGEGLDDLEPFDPDSFVTELLEYA